MTVQHKTQRKPKLNKPKSTNPKRSRFVVSGFSSNDNPLLTDDTLSSDFNKDAETIIEWMRSQIPNATYQSVVRMLKDK